MHILHFEKFEEVHTNGVYLIRNIDNGLLKIGKARDL
jgi:hypothetical protein